MQTLAVWYEAEIRPRPERVDASSVRIWTRTHKSSGRQEQGSEEMSEIGELVRLIENPRAAAAAPSADAHASRALSCRHLLRHGAE
jgi:hypothetical protein